MQSALTGTWPDPRRLQARLRGEHAPERRRLHARRPDLRHRGEPLDAAAGLQLDACGVHSRDQRPRSDLDAHPLELRRRPPRETLVEARQDPRRRVEQDDARGRGVDPPEVRPQAVARQLGDLPGHLHARRAGADDDEGQPRGAAHRVLLELGQLEGAEDPPAHLERVVDRLHARGVDGELVVAEVRLRRAGGDDQAVVGELPGPVEQPAGDGAALEVDAADLGEDDLRVALVAEDVPERRRDVPLRQDARRHLVEQRLEEVVRLPVDQRHVDGRPAQRLRGGEAAEAAADDHDPMAMPSSG